MTQANTHTHIYTHTHTTMTISHIPSSLLPLHLQHLQEGGRGQGETRGDVPGGEERGWAKGVASGRREGRVPCGGLPHEEGPAGRTEGEWRQGQERGTRWRKR